VQENEPKEDAVFRLNPAASTMLGAGQRETKTKIPEKRYQIFSYDGYMRLCFV
jgi:hypothetical protein